MLYKLIVLFYTVATNIMQCTICFCFFFFYFIKLGRGRTRHFSLSHAHTKIIELPTIPNLNGVKFIQRAPRGM